MPNEENSVEGLPDQDGPEISGVDDLLYSLADAVRTKQSKEAVALLNQKLR